MSHEPLRTTLSFSGDMRWFFGHPLATSTGWVVERVEMSADKVTIWFEQSPQADPPLFVNSFAVATP